MRFLDLFSGIGGLALGLERAGHRAAAFCEVDPFCRRVLARQWPGVPLYIDIRKLTAARLQADAIPNPDLIAGGFPCQDVSTAGRGAGLHGESSRLAFELLRLVAECRPRWLLLENSPALRVRGADELLGELDALGYAGWPLVVGAAHAGAPHRRARVFVLAYATGARLEGGQSESALSPMPAAGCGGWQAEPGLGRVADGLPTRLDRRARLRALGNAVVPDVAEAIGHALHQAAEDLTRSAKLLRNLDTFGATTARQ